MAIQLGGGGGPDKVLRRLVGSPPRPYAAPAMSARRIIRLLALPLLLLAGLFTRPVAFVLSGEMAFAYFMVHAPQSPWPLFNHGDLAVAFCFAFLYLSAAGGGPWSLDRLLRRA